MRLLLATVFAILTFPLAAGTITGRVTRVVDGDTIYVRADGRTHKIRLAGIDAPEMSQRHGPEAARYLRSRLRGRTVWVSYRIRDRYRRIIGWVDIEPNPTQAKSVNAVMVYTGWAWVYRRYYRRGKLYVYEQYARSSYSGIWGEECKMYAKFRSSWEKARWKECMESRPTPVPPWRYRRYRRRSR